MTTRIGKMMVLAFAAAFIIFISEFNFKANSQLVNVQDVNSIAIWSIVKAAIIAIGIVLSNEFLGKKRAKLKTN